MSLRGFHLLASAPFWALRYGTQAKICRHYSLYHANIFYFSKNVLRSIPGLVLGGAFPFGIDGAGLHPDVPGPEKRCKLLFIPLYNNFALAKNALISIPGPFLF